ncbi:hybrid sensor histidine kinase/response regulator [Anaerobacillus alkalilacustris]|uniref:histidine kinase n=2 Tax=Anaerobacillus alkalilacustris TaxID=393763 RepID=A0A1S2LYW8_9BACI|nr:hybrid sensor histidine kinase/response regulator [Anaerobacillus alkalilacustris]
MVDDHPENLLALRAVLTSPNYHLVSASSGKEALKCMLKEDFAVILLDVQMPGLNGFETAELIKEREKTRYIPIIFITAISQDIEHVNRGYSVGAIDYIFKPFNPETLRQKIEQFVKIHQKHEESKLLGEWEHSIEIKEINQELDRTTLNLRRSEALSKVIGETLMDTIVTFDENGHILSVNPSIQRMFGFNEVELLGKHVGELFKVNTEEKVENSQSFILFSMKASIGKVIEAVALRKNGSEFPVDVQIGETIIEGQQIFVCTIRNVTERKQIEEVKKQQFENLEKIVAERTVELRMANENLQKEIEQRKKIADNLYVSEERFRKIFESSPCLKAIISIKEGTYIDANPSWINITGYNYDEIRNQNINILNIVEEFNGDLIDIEQPNRNIRINYKTKSNEIRAGLLSSELIEIHKEICVLIVITDVTDRVLLEKEMSRLDRLNLIGEMAAGIAHEIRNPMTTVHGFLQVARSNRDQLPVEIVDLMMDELTRANSIITEFLNLAKNKVSDRKNQNLNSIIKALFPLIQAEALRSSKHITINLADCPSIFIDQKEIRQLILNIALNGLDAMSPGGKLTIKTYLEEHAVVLKIKDQGSGMKPEVLDKIGTPFYTTKENGTGLGLAICYSIAERHHADIQIATGDNGTTFYIRFNIETNI